LSASPIGPAESSSSPRKRRGLCPQKERMTPPHARAAAALAPVQPGSAALAPWPQDSLVCRSASRRRRKAGQRQDGDVFLQTEEVVIAGDERRTLVFRERDQVVVPGDRANGPMAALSGPPPTSAGEEAAPRGDGQEPSREATCEARRPERLIVSQRVQRRGSVKQFPRRPWSRDRRA
jgi:hypothetical protein